MPTNEGLSSEETAPDVTLGEIEERLEADDYIFKGGQTEIVEADMRFLIRAVRQWHARAKYLEPLYLNNVPMPHMDDDVLKLLEENESYKDEEWTHYRN